MIPSVKNYNADTFPPVFVIASTVVDVFFVKD